MADLRVFNWLGFYGLGVITAITSQNTLEVKAIHPLGAAPVRDQLDVLLDDVTPAAVKTGMLAAAETVEAVAEAVSNRKAGWLVVDPVLKSTGGFDLGGRKVARAIQKHLLPLAEVITPNLDEAETLTGLRIRTETEAVEAARRLASWGARAVCITGGHFRGPPVDVFLGDSGPEIFPGARQGGGREFHGSGCFFSAALTCLLAEGRKPVDAVGCAKKLVEKALAGAVRPGSGNMIPWPGGSLEPERSKH